TVSGGVEANGGVAPATEEVVAGAHILNRGDLLGVVADGAFLLAGFDVPNLDGVVGPGARDTTAIGLPGDVEHMMRVTLESADGFAGCDVEHLDELVGGPRDEVPAVAGEVDAENRVAVGVFEDPDGLALGHVPEHQFAVA